ncbi:hypothetical protein [Vibrio variabilis]|uniref:hypothetical protein n=1 Tax=Vibrio variabilis TaxID=990271 RepID=UPI0013A6C1A0|nr:hypothetical protein [Vibrio variabilis]
MIDINNQLILNGKMLFMDNTSIINSAFEHVNQLNTQSSQFRFPMSILVSLTKSSEGTVISAVNREIERWFVSLQSKPDVIEQLDISFLQSQEYVTVQSSLKPLKESSVPLFSAIGANRALAQGLEVVMSMLRTAVADSKANSVTCRRPWCVVVTDGQATDVWTDSAAKLKHWSCEKSIVPIIINLGEYDESLEEYSVVPVLNASFNQLPVVFDWLKESIECIASSQPGTTVRLPELPL